MKDDNALVLMNTAHQKIQLAKSLPEVKDIHDKAKTLQEYAKQQKLGLEMQNDLAEIVIRAERKAGELLKETELDKGGRPTEDNQSNDSTSLPKLKDLGISKFESSSWQRIAEIPEDDFEQHIQETKQNRKELTTVDCIRLARKYERKEETETPIIQSENLFDVFYADPPWRYDFSPTESRAIEQNYPTMELQQIKELNIPSNDNAVLFLWATAPKLKEALDVMNAWGFEYKTHMIWDKEKIGMGYWFRNQHELLLVGVKGNFSPPIDKDRISSIFHSKRSKHSKKPEEIRDFIKNWYPDKKRMELFAREKTIGWSSWGNEI